MNLDAGGVELCRLGRVGAEEAVGQSDAAESAADVCGAPASPGAAARAVAARRRGRAGGGRMPVDPPPPPAATARPVPPGAGVLGAGGAPPRAAARPARRGLLGRLATRGGD